MLLALLLQADDLATLRSDAAKALRETAGAGAFAVKGEMDLDTDDEAMKDAIAEWFETLPEIGGVASSGPFKAHATLRVEQTRYDVYHDGGTVERIMWRGWQEYFDQVADELLSLLDLESMAKAVESATGAKSLPDGKVGDVECRSMRLVLKPASLKSYVEIEEYEEMADEMRPKKLEARLWIGKTDGRVHKLEWTVGREESMDETEATYVLDRIYSVTLRDHGKAKVEIPADVKEMFGD